MLGWFRGEITTREVLWLIERLPDSGAFAAQQRAEVKPQPKQETPGWLEQLGWGMDRHIAALAADAQLAQLGTKGSKPARIPRPAESPGSGGHSLASEVEKVWASATTANGQTRARG